MPAQESASSTATPSTAPAPKLADQVQDFIKEQSPELKRQLDSVNALVNHPLSKAGATLVQDQEFTSAVSRISNAHGGTRFLAYEGVLLILVWIFRAWRLSKSNTLLPRLLTQAWIGAVYWILAITVVPWLVWGEAFRTALGHLVKVALRQFLA